MDHEHVISGEALAQIGAGLAKGENWLAYNEVNYFLGPQDVFGFGREEEALEFASGNISEYDSFRVLQVDSIEDAFNQITYGGRFEQILAAGQPQTIFHSSLNQKIMNTENLEYLTRSLQYTGFGDKLNKELERNIQQQPADFRLEGQYEFNKQKIDVSLSFRKGEQNDMYFFNNYSATLKNENDPSQDRSQTFYINKGSGITLKEAFNLLEGRAVHKELTNKEDQKYKAWVQLDLSDRDDKGNYKQKQFHANYGFDLEKVLNQLPVKELGDAVQKERLIQSLEKGNLQSVTLQKDGNGEKMFLEANPQYKNVQLYDSNGKNVKLADYTTQGTEQKKSNGTSRTTSEEKGGDVVKEQKPEPYGKKNKKEKQEGADSLMPKKRVGNKKGLAV